VSGNPSVKEEGLIDKRKPSFPMSQLYTTEIAQHENTLLSEDSYFFNFLNSKVRLTELGLYILGSIKGKPTRFEQPVDYANQYDVSMFNPPSTP
jgi:hypothetical protein